MKKIFAVLLVFVLIISLSACGNDANLNTDSTSIDTKESSSIENTTSTGLEGLIDVNASPIGKSYDGINGSGFTTKFYGTGKCSDYYVETGEWNDFDEWSTTSENYIKRNLGNGSYWSFFIYNDYLVKVDVETVFGTLEGDAEVGFYNDAERCARVLYKDGTYHLKNTKGMIVQNGTYEIIKDRIIKTEATDGVIVSTYYWFIDNNNCVHQAYPEVK